MQLNDVASLVKLLDKSSLTEISFSDETSKIVLKKEVFRAAPMQTGMMTMPMAMAAPAAAPAIAAPAYQPAGTPGAGPEKAGNKFKEVTSPMVGTYYASSSPGSPALTQVGTTVKAGQVLCIIEAMKIMNEIESDVSGVVEEVCVQNETPVEYGTVLFRIRPG
ncbi:MAG: acetyl-CoA carboxylase, biotin carboxyl carrier protein [Fibrobacteres bacterium]|nr:acetyl-CoA carboxylase, biotin carboxyl carrier protein [Fibrobacterota bacterium]